MPLRLHPDVQRVNASGSLLLFDTRSGSYYALNTSADTVLDALADDGGAQAATSALVKAHGITPDRAAADVAALTAALARYHLLEGR
ncbi:PqqD family peptide modification chaperone [Streptomyces sp. NBC_01187]|uniref:PqqD family peptide modification chaperone n=1 Tax=Streptomyces sp. NBC_01187 TaxID=2903766 RepID=UPI00386475B4|nr:PqqD family peptide modification chaperone [Streptomyces sp. NBC_01187]